jgi:hypothetical protein
MVGVDVKSYFSVSHCGLMLACVVESVVDFLRCHPEITPADNIKLLFLFLTLNYYDYFLNHQNTHRH